MNENRNKTNKKNKWIINKQVQAVLVSIAMVVSNQSKRRTTLNSNNGKSNRKSHHYLSSEESW